MITLATKALFIINPLSGGRNKDFIVPLIEQASIKHHCNCIVRFTAYSGHAQEITSSCKEGDYLFIAVAGGDGTVHEAASGLFNKKIPLAIIPLGSGNGLANTLGISNNVEKAIAICFTGKIQHIDVLRMNEHLSFNLSGIGFDAAVARRFQHLKKRGLLGYIQLVWKEMFHIQTFSYTLNDSQNDKREGTAWMISVANSNQYGNHIKIAPSASLVDGLFDLIILKPCSWWKMPGLLLYLLMGKIQKHSAVLSMPLKSCTIQLSREIPFHIDGEPSGANQTFQLKIIPLAFPVIVPQ